MRSSKTQVGQLIAWAARFEERTWAVEGAGGVGYLLAQQLVAVGERVVDVPATLASRVRVLGSGRSNKTDANDGYSIAVAARHAPHLANVAPADHRNVLRLLTKRNKELGSARTRTVCRLHALLVELVPGGIAKELTANRAAALLAEVTPSDPVEATRHELAGEHLEDLRRIDEQMRVSKRRLADAVAASRTTVTELFGFGPVGTAIALGQARDISRFADRDHFAAYNGTAPIEVASGGRSVHRLSRRGNRQLNHAIHIAAITQIRHPHLTRRGTGWTVEPRAFCDVRPPLEPVPIADSGAPTHRPSIRPAAGRLAHSRVMRRECLLDLIGPTASAASSSPTATTCPWHHISTCRGPVDFGSARLQAVSGERGRRAADAIGRAVARDTPGDVGGHPAMMDDMEEVEVVVAHHERATLRVGDVFLKVDADQTRTDVEVEAMAMAPVPTPEILWRKPPVLALAALPGTALGRLGEPSTASSTAWAAAGAAARTLHDAPLPPWPGWSLDEFASHVDSECEWLVANDVLLTDAVTHNRRVAEAALRPWTPVFTHGDLQVAHVFVEDDEVTGVVDWSDACQGDALFDLAILTLGHEEHLDDVVAGYGSDVDLDVIRGWWSLRSLLAVRWLVEHGFDPSPEVAVLHARQVSPNARS